MDNCSEKVQQAIAGIAKGAAQGLVGGTIGAAGRIAGGGLNAIGGIGNAVGGVGNAVGGLSRKAAADQEKKNLETRKQLQATEEFNEYQIGGGNLKKLARKAVKESIQSNVDGKVDTEDMKSPETGEFLPSPTGKKLKPKVRFEGVSDWRTGT